MNYQLAKKLKDAGFPQFLGERGVLENYYCEQGEEMVYRPTLSELIGACFPEPKGYFGLTYKKRNWRATIAMTTATYGDGSSPEEAVANLYLALNPITL